MRSIHCTKHEEILNGKLHFLCSDTLGKYQKNSKFR